MNSEKICSFDVLFIINGQQLFTLYDVYKWLHYNNKQQLTFTAITGILNYLLCKINDSSLQCIRIMCVLHKTIFSNK